MRSIRWFGCALLAAVVVTGCGGASGGVPQAKYDKLKRRLDQLKLESSGECATACTDCRAKVRNLKDEIAELKFQLKRGTGGAAPERPVAERPRRERPVAERPRRERPVAERPRRERPVVERPRRERPVAERPRPRREPPPEEPTPSETASSVPHGLSHNPLSWKGTVSEGLSTVAVLRAVLRNKEQFRRCYAGGLGKIPGLTARIKLRVRVSGSGRVKKVKITGITNVSPSPGSRKTRKVVARMSKCARKAMKKVRFPKPAGKKRVKVVYPIEYKGG